MYYNSQQYARPNKVVTFNLWQQSTLVFLSNMIMTGRSVQDMPSLCGKAPFRHFVMKFILMSFQSIRVLDMGQRLGCKEN